jgi:hypothetical protein
MNIAVQYHGRAVNEGNMKTALASARAGCLASAVALGAAWATAASATTFNYTAAAGDVVGNFSFTTSLSGAALDNLAPDTPISVTAFTFQPTGLDHDTAGYTVGGAFGSSYFNASGVSVQIGTNALGQITSWNISENVFVSWPAVPGENPSDYFGRYTITLTNLGDTRTLVQDHDVGLAPGRASSGAGSFGAQVSATPLPAALPLFAGGLGVLGLFGWRRQRKTRTGSLLPA